MQRKRGTRGSSQDDQQASRRLGKKRSEEKNDEKDKKKGGVLKRLGFLLHNEKKEEVGSTQKRRKPKRGTERKRACSHPIWNPDKKIHFNNEKTHATIPLKGDPLSDVQKKVFFKFASDAVKKNPPEYSTEFMTKVKTYPGQPMERKIFDANPTKNRYKDVVCNDITRVILNDGGEGDYIHANYVNGLNAPFILTQGATAATVIDFWRMVVHTKTAYIVMLCEVMEDGKAKCAQYYPEKAGEAMTFGPWTILCSLEDDKDANIIKRTLSVRNVDNGKEHILKHLHTKSWPDRCVPNSTMALLRMLYIVRTASGPVTVHCSAGIGRTGTFVAIEACLQILTDGKELDLLGTCRALRNSRAGSIQVDIQYMALVQILINYGKDNGYWDDSDLDDRVELLTWNIQQFIQTRGKVDHVPTTPSTPALNIIPADAKPVPVVPREATPHHSPAEKAQECVEKICEKILKPIKKDKEHKSPKTEHPKECKEHHPLPLETKSSSEDGPDVEDPKTQATQKVEIKEFKETDNISMITLTPDPPPVPSTKGSNNVDTKESKEILGHEKLVQKQNANRSQYFM